MSLTLTEEARANFRRARVNPDERAETLRRLATGALAWVVVSGKMTSGKDTVAPELVNLMPTAPTMLRYGNLMRAELDPALDLLTERVRQDAALRPTVHEIADLMDLRPEYAEKLVTVLAPEIVASNGTLTTHSRTDGIRKVLQDLGDDWRCLDDPDYWARKAMHAALAELDAGNSVILTGGRFLPDVDLPRAANAYLLRLDVTRETQLARLAGRDGLTISEDTLRALDHPSETELDDYPHFDVRINNDDDLGATLATARTALTARLAAA